MKHILLKNIEFRKRLTPAAGDAFSYDVFDGVWCAADTNLLLVNDESFAGIASKKRDIETGEDQK